MVEETYLRSLVTKRCGGVTFDVPGAGYSFSNVLAEEREAMKANIPGDPSSALLRLSIADPTWKMPKSAMVAALGYYESDPESTRYKDNSGIPGTHEGIAAYLNMAHSGSGVIFDERWVQHSPGSIKRLLAEYIPSLLFDRDTHLLFPTPGYPVIKSEINRRGAKVTDVPLLFNGVRWVLDYERMNAALAETKATRNKAVLYLNMPHNPTGATINRVESLELVLWANDNNVIVIVDEAYSHLRYDDSESMLNTPGWQNCCIVLQSVSKGWSATGLRFGWAVAHPTLIKALRKVTDVKDSGLFGPSIAAGLWCLNNTAYAAQTCKDYLALHEGLLGGLQTAGFESGLPQAGLCQFTRAPRVANGVQFNSATECAQFFRKELRISLMSYDLEGEQGPQGPKDPWLRWAVTFAPIVDCGLPDQKSVITEAVRRLQSVQLEF